MAPADALAARTHVHQQDIEAALCAVGVKLGDVALLHSSLSSMGYVVGGAETVIEAFLAVLGPGGTLALPTLIYASTHEGLAAKYETWDIETSPSDVGRITEVGRLWPGAVRSHDPTHSVAAIGARAREITQDHARASGRPSPWSPNAFGPGSPWDKLYEWNAHYLFLGVDMGVNTIGHLAQALYVVECLEQAGERRAELEQEIRAWRKAGVWPDFHFAAAEEWLKASGRMRYAPVGDALLRATRARDDVDTILHKLRTEGDALLPGEFLEWRRNALGE